MARNPVEAIPPASDSGASRLAREVGRRMKQARLQGGLSMSDLGAKIGVSYQQVQKYEAGIDTIPLHRLLTLAAFWGVPPETFWRPEDAVPADAAVSGATDLSALQLVRAYRRIANAEVRNRLLRLVKEMAGDDGKTDAS